MAKKQPQLCLVTYLATSGAQIHAVVTTAQRILLAQVGRLIVDHGLVDQGMPVAEVPDAMAALKSIAGTADLTKMHVPKPQPWGFDLPEPVCTCRASGLGRVLDPNCQIHGSYPAVTCTCPADMPLSHDTRCPVHGWGSATCTCKHPGQMPITQSCPVHGGAR